MCIYTYVIRNSVLQKVKEVSLKMKDTETISKKDLSFYISEF